MSRRSAPRTWTDAIGGIDERDRAVHRFYEALNEQAVEQSVTSAGGERVDYSSSPRQAENGQVRRISAADMRRMVRVHCGVENVRLLDALSLTDGGASNWRQQVQTVTGESNPVAQAACARQALRGLVTAVTRARIDLNQVLTD